jgi:hypothetical protein
MKRLIVFNDTFDNVSFEFNANYEILSVEIDGLPVELSLNDIKQLKEFLNQIEL